MNISFGGGNKEKSKRKLILDASSHLEIRRKFELHDEESEIFVKKLKALAEERDKWHKDFWKEVESLLTRDGLLKDYDKKKSFLSFDSSCNCLFLEEKDDDGIGALTNFLKNL